MIHELKISPEFFDEIVSGKKTFEVRVDDRPYKIGDYLALNEYRDGEKEAYTGSCVLVYVTYILRHEAYCKDGYVVIAFKPCEIWMQPLVSVDTGMPRIELTIYDRHRRNGENDSKM